MSGIFTKMRRIPVHYPLIRGMISYSIIWPTCSIVQEYLDHGATLEEANFARAARFGIFGSLFMAPVFYGWMKFSGRFFRSNTLKNAMLRAAIEQVSYSPLAMAYFFFGMSLLEFKPLHACWNEVKEKFWPTYKMGVIFWPTAQTFNFYCVSEKNRVVFVSIASLIWTIYLAHMKAKEPENLLLDQNINVLKMSETLTNYKVVVESDSLINKKVQPLDNASDNPNDSKKSKLKKKPEAALGVAPKDQVVTESDSNKRTITNPIPLATVPLVTPIVPDKIIPATPIIDTDKANPTTKVPVQPETKPVNDFHTNLDSGEHTITVENTINSNQIATDLYEQSIDTSLSDYKDNISTALLNVGIDTDLVTPKVDAAFVAKRSGSGDDDKSKAGELSAGDGKTTDPAAVESPKDVIILSDNSLIELPIAEEERLKIID